MTTLPTPYYDADGITIYLGDCRTILPLLPKVDLICTDPPYGLGDKLLGGNWGRRIGAAAVWDQKTEDVQHLLSRSEHQIIWGGNYFSLPISRCWLGWVKRDAVPTVATMDLAWTSFDAPAKFFDWTIAATNGERNGHPTLKPLQLMRWCIDQSTRMGCPSETICDPYMGSGTTLRAAKDLGRQAIGIEINEAYVKIAVERLRQQVLNLG